MQAPENANAERQHTTGSSEKVVTIETCRECKTHRSNTWHDETKYEANFKLVQAAINALTPEVEVIRKVDGPINLGAFEIKHGEQLIYSKKNTGLWPNAKAVAQRVKTYFEDLSSGKNVSNYGKQKETAYIPKRVPGEARASTSAGFRSTKLGEKNNTQASAKTLTPAKQVKADSAGGSPGEEELEGGEDRIKGEEDHHHDADEHKSKTPEHHAEEEAHPVGAAGHHHEEHKEEHNKPASGHATPKHESAAPEPVHENKAAHEEHKEQPGSAHLHEEPKGSEPNSAVKSQEPESAAKGSEPHSAAHGSEPQSAGHGSEPHSAAKGSEPQSAAEPHTAAKGSEPNSAATPKENKGDDKEYEEDFS